MKFFNLLLPFTMLLVLAGCVSHEYEDVTRSGSATIPYQFEVGDTVNIITADSQEYEFKIENISDTGVTGDGHSIQFDDMRIVRMRSVDTGRTVRDTSELTFWIMNILVVIGLMVISGG